MSLRPDWLPALAAFEAAARHQNFAHAAEELHLTASAVSHHVRKLEARLGVSLFQRHARGVALTAEGRLLADGASSAMSDLDSLLRELRGTPAREARVVRVTTLHSLVHGWLLPLLPGFQARHPDIRVVIDTEVALTRFDEGGPDLGIRHGPGHWPGLTALTLMDDTLFPVGTPALAQSLAGGTAADVARLPLIADLGRQGWPDWFRGAGVHGARPDVRFTFSDSTDAQGAAAAGLGAALAREKIVRAWLADGRLARLPGPAIPARWSYHVVHPAHRRPRPAAQLFIDWLMEASAPERATSPDAPRMTARRGRAR